MIMVLALLIYAFGEWLLRKKLSETGMNVPNQLKKPTQVPNVGFRRRKTAMVEPSNAKAVASRSMQI